jgi:hypothetical protein
MGIWIGTSDEDLQLVVRTGEIVGGNLLTGLPTDIGGLDSNRFDLNEYAVVWIGSFQSPGRAVVLSRPAAGIWSRDAAWSLAGGPFNE